VLGTGLAIGPSEVGEQDDGLGVVADEVAERGDGGWVGAEVPLTRARSRILPYLMGTLKSVLTTSCEASLRYGERRLRLTFLNMERNGIVYEKLHHNLVFQIIYDM
jgi:hypothetical protein